jgi:hypothetical protein
MMLKSQKAVLPPVPTYSRLQFECLDDKTRQGIKTALLRYCELDTLAMVMIVEAWAAECQKYA